MGSTLSAVTRIMDESEEEKGIVESGGAQQILSKSRERAIVSRTNIGTVSKAKWRKLLRDRVERIWASPSAQTPPTAELNWHPLMMILMQSFMSSTVGWHIRDKL